MRVFPLFLRAALGSVSIVAQLATTLVPARAIPASAGGVLVWPEVTAALWPEALDPALAIDPSSEQIVDLLYSGLVKLDGHNNVVPDLAESLPRISPDRRVYTFALRPQLRFSDGSSLTAGDVAYSIARATSKQEASPNAAPLYLNHIQGVAAWHAGKAANLTGVKVLDAHTVQITLDRPIGYFLEALTFPASYVVKRTVAAGEDLVGSGAQARLVGAGPWVFAGPWRYRQEMDFKPNPYWYRAGHIKLSELHIPFISTPETNYREYLAGQMPVTSVPSAYVPADRKRRDFHAGQLLGFDFVMPNQGKDSQCMPVSCAPFNDLHFRRALLYAVDRQTITQQILHGTAAPLCGMVPQGIAGYAPRLCALTPYDPARARRELTLARKDFGGTLPNENRLTVIFTTISQDTANEYQQLQLEWRAVGINMGLVAVPFNRYVTLVSSASTPFIQGALGADYPDAQDFLQYFVSRSPYNDSNYHNSAFDRMTERADAMPNGPGRTRLYIEAQKLMIDDVAAIAISQPMGSFRWRTTIHGLVTSTNWPWPQPLNEDWTNVWVG
jgi:ABC-type oligopeptide transport system substrate-binding subunit